MLFVEAAVEQKDSALFQILEHVVHVHVCEFVTGEEVGGRNQIRPADRPLAEAQVRHRDAAGFFRVVRKIRLSVEVGARVADNFDCDFVRADRTVGTESVEHRFGHALFGDKKVGIVFQRRLRYVVVDADRKVIFHFIFRVEIFEARNDHRRRKLFRADTVAAADNQSFASGFFESRTHVFVERLSQGTGFFRAVEYDDLFRRFRNRREEFIRSEGTVQVYFYDADFFAFLFAQIFDRFVSRVRARSHDDHNRFRVFCADVIVEFVFAAGKLCELRHFVLYDRRDSFIIIIDRFAALEVHVGILRSTADFRTLGIQTASAMCAHEVVIDHAAHLIERHFIVFLDFMRCAESVEKVQERNTRTERRRMRNDRHILRFLYGVRREHSPARLTASHDVRMIAENRQGARCDGTCRNMKYRARQFACDFVHIRNHQEQALRSRKRRAQRSRRQRTVYGARSSRFRLHFDNRRHRAPNIFFVLCRQIVGNLTHRAGRSNRINRNYFAQRMRNASDRSVGVERYFLFFCCHGSFLFLKCIDVKRVSIRTLYFTPDGGDLQEREMPFFRVSA